MKISILGATSSVGFNLIKIFCDEYPDVELKIAGRNITKLEYLKQKYANVASIHKFKHGSNLNEILIDTSACVDLSYQISGVPSQIIKSSKLHAKNLIYESRNNLIKNVIIVGSVGVYGEPKITYKWDETPLPKKVKPNTLYGLIKLVVEKEVWKNSKNISPNIFLLRVGHIFGASTKMINSLVLKLINNEPVLLDGRSAFSNSTTISGLCKSIINLCLNEKFHGRFCANHVDLRNKPYEYLVNSLAKILDVEPNKLPFIKKGKLGTSIFSYINKYQNKISIFQSKIGLYDYGLSEILLNKIKPKFGAYKIKEQFINLDYLLLNPIYNSNKVSHSTDLLGEQLEFDLEIEKISEWINNVGFKV